MVPAPGLSRGPPVRTVKRMTPQDAPHDKTTAGREWPKQRIRWGLCAQDKGADPVWDTAVAAVAPGVVRARRLYSDEAGGFAKQVEESATLASQGIMALVSVTPHSNNEPDWARMTREIAQYGSGHGFIANHEFLNPDHVRDPMLWSSDQLKFKDCLRETDWWMPNLNGYAFSGKRGYQATFRNRGGWATVTDELTDAVAARPFSAWTWDCYDGGKPPVAGESPGDRVRIGVDWCISRGITNVAFPEWGTFDDTNFADTLAAIKEVNALPNIRVVAACEWAHVGEGMWDPAKIAMMRDAFTA